MNTEIFKRVLYLSMFIFLLSVDISSDEVDDLIAAIEAGNIASIETLVESGTSLDDKRRFRMSGELNAIDIAALHRGGRFGNFDADDLDVVMYLLEAGGKFSTSQVVYPVITAAVGSDRLDDLKILIELPIVKEALYEGTKQEMVFVATNNESISTLGFLIQKGWGWRSPLSGLLSNEYVDVEILKVFFSSGVKIGDLPSQWIRYPRKRPDVMLFLIELGYDVKNAYGEQAFLNAAESAGYGGNQLWNEVLKVFIEKGIDINVADDSGKTALLRFLEVGKGDFAVVRWFIENEADVNAAEPRDGQTPLLEAIYSGKSVEYLMEVSRLLIEHGADINQYGGQQKWTPLMAAARREYFPLVAYLVGSGADVNAINPRWNETADKFTDDAYIEKYLLEAQGKSIPTQSVQVGTIAKATTGLLVKIEMVVIGSQTRIPIYSNLWEIKLTIGNISYAIRKEDIAMETLPDDLYWAIADKEYSIDNLTNEWSVWVQMDEADVFKVMISVIDTSGRTIAADEANGAFAVAAINSWEL